jgi:hypothetical protein
VKYLCLIYDAEKRLAALSRARSASLLDEYAAFTDGIRATGHHLGGEALEPSANGRTVRVRDGRISTTDGPFAETTEQLGGYYLIEARDLNDAIQVASRIPSARTGSIEVRPVVEFAA